MAKEIPVYRISIESDAAEIIKLSLVDKPAIQVDFVKFAQEQSLYKFEANKEKQIVSGPFMIPEMPIYRVREDIGEHFVVFSAEQIETLKNKFASKNRNTAINMMHETDVVDAYIVENWIIEDTEFDKSNKLGYKLPVGTWFGSVKIDSTEFWNKEIKSGSLKGFSIEGFLGIEDKPSGTIKMNTQKFMETTLKDGTKIKVSEAGPVVDSEVVIIAEDGTETPAPNGEHILADGTTIVVTDGKITEVKEEMAADPAGAPPATVDFEAAIASLREEFTTALTALTEKINELEAAKTKVEEKNTEMAKQFEKMQEIPVFKSMFIKDDGQKTEPKIVKDQNYSLNKIKQNYKIK